MYTTNYNQDPTQARLNALYLQLCASGGNGDGTITIENGCFLATGPNGKQVVELCFNDWDFPSQNVSLVNFDILPGDSTVLFDNKLTNYVATPLPVNKSYVRGVVIKVTYPNTDANGVTVDPSLYTCKMTVTNLMDNQGPAFASAGNAINAVAEASPLTPSTPFLYSTINLVGSVAATGGATVTKYQWTKVSAPTGDVSGIYTPNASSTKVTNLIPGRYVFQLDVTNSNSEATSSMAFVNISLPTDTPPTVYAGPDQIVTIEQAQSTPINVTALATPNAGASIASVLWSQTGGPNVVSFGTPDQLTTTIDTVTMPGLYTFNVTVIDTNGFTTDDTLTVTVTSLQSFDMPLNTLYAHFCNPVTTDATQILNSISIQNISANMPMCVQAMLVSNASQPVNPNGSTNNTCNC